MISGFNHLSNPSEFYRVFNKNRKPVMFALDDGRTVIMSRSSNCYEGILDGKLYILNGDGITSSNIGGGLPVVTIDTDLADFDSAYNPNIASEIYNKFPCTVAGTYGGKSFKAFPSISHAGDDGTKSVSFIVTTVNGLAPGAFLYELTASEASGFSKIHIRDY